MDDQSDWFLNASGSYLISVVVVLSVCSDDIGVAFHKEVEAGTS